MSDVAELSRDELLARAAEYLSSVTYPVRHQDPALTLLYLQRHLPGKHDQSTHGRRGGVRASLNKAKTTDEVAAVLASEASALTGHPLEADFDGADVQISREHAEGILQGVERFPHAGLTKVTTYGPGSRPSATAFRGEVMAPTSYAVTDHDNAPPMPLPGGRHSLGATIAFNNARTADATAYRTAINKPRSEFSVATTPRGAALHEYGHVVSEKGRPHQPAYAVTQHVRSQAQAAGDLPKYYIAQHVSRYASSQDSELSAEIFADVMINGSKAAGLSKSSFAVMEQSHQGFVQEVGL